MSARRAGLRSRLLRGTAIALVVVVALGIGAGLWLRGRVLASLPVLDGEVTLPGLGSEVRVERDAHGVPTLHGADRDDVGRALGFLHGQERFFQMDLLRRRAAGELSALFGRAALAEDRRMRLHRFRGLARSHVDALGDDERRLITVYAAGVNAGLATLEDKPPEYLALRRDPAPWLAEDSVLVLLAMYDTLQSDTPAYESMRGLVLDLYPSEMLDFLSPVGTGWDAPLSGGPLVGPGIPGSQIFDLRDEPVTERQEAARLDAGDRMIAGSNNWAVAGTRTADGGALVANDMHLPLMLPNIWYRAVLEFDEGGERRRLAGVTLPGSPTLVAGSNGDVAWGFTNSQGDWADLVVIEIDPADPERYLSPEGSLPFSVSNETIEIAGGGPETIEVRGTIWGPVVDHDHRDRPRALRWIAHEPRKGEVIGLSMERARTLEAALDAANASGIPTQNVVIADRAGRIGWALMGPMPRRLGCDGAVPRSWADGRCRWEGTLAASEHPRIVDPPDGQLWTANNRTLDGDDLARMGDGGFATGARARQIRDGLTALDAATPADLLALQLDDRALFLERWRDLLLETLDAESRADDPRRETLARLVRDGWTGRASVDSVGFRLVRAFRQFLGDRLLADLTARCRAASADFDPWRLGQVEGPLWALVHEHPLHLLAPRYATWRDALLDGADAVIAFAEERGGLEGLTWGARNTVTVRHPLSLAVPRLSRWLDGPPVELPGDASMPRVQSPTFGASERFVVSPGREEDGIFHMPGGQSGHPFAPHYLAGHDAWARGEPTPFLPGPTAHTLLLRP